MAKYGFTIKLEEYTTLGDFILPSFTRDLPIFTARFTPFNAAYLAKFTTKLALVKTLESTLVPTEQQKKATASLYAEATEVNNELNFLKEYFKDADLNQSIITDIKTNLFNHDIEAAALQLEALRQYVVTNHTVLQNQGMATTYPALLQTHQTSLAAKNKEQSEFMKKTKKITDTNKAHYAELYEYISQIAGKGKLLFKGNIIQDEYNISKYLSKMRSNKRGNNNKSVENN
jgi:hypothetical protein